MLRTRIDIEWGSLEYDSTALERVGDRLLPKWLDAVFPGADGQPALRMRLELRGGVPQCAQVHIEASPEGREVRTADLRAVALEDWVETFYSLAATVVVDEDPETGSLTGVVTSDPALRRQTARLVQNARSTARRKITPEFLAGVADVYRANVDERPVEAVRAVFGGSYRTAAMYVQRARADGHLPPTTAGKKNA